MTVSAAKQPDVSVIIATYNRCEVLRGALERLLNQDAPWTDYEVIVVDNNSTDETRRTVDDMREILGADNLIYCFQPQQGVSHARNRGIAVARAPILAFTDDDIRPARDWVSAINAGFKRFPQVDCIGGKVLPDPDTKFPDWLTSEHWTPLALLDLGDQALELDVRNGPGLVGANLVLRAAVFKEIGLFPTELQRVKDSIGSLEDHEFQLRLSAAGKRLMYLPELVVHAHVLEERFDKSYHRRWYCGHGHFYAVMRNEQFESSKMRLFDVPAHLYRRTLTHGLNWLKYRLTTRGDLKFQQELELHFFWGFLRKRFSDRRSILQLSKSRTNNHAKH